MDSTIKIYENDPYMKELESNVIKIIESDGSFLVVLDRTIFFPEGGGQPCDMGYIDDVRVSYVYEKDGIVYHKVDKEISEKKVLIKLDYDRRLDHMQQHCGEHILSGVFLKLYGGKNKGFHMGEDYVTADIDLEDITEEMVKKAEEQANKDIYESREVKTYVVDKEQAERLPLRKELKVDSDIRIVEIDGVDMVACCGTHPKLTSEVGIIKVLKTEKYKKMTRVYFVCGMRAFREYQKSYSLLSSLSKFYSTDQDSLISKAESEAEKLKDSYIQIKELKNKLFIIEAEELAAEEKSDLVSNIYKDKTFDDIQLLAGKINQKGKIALLSSKENRILLTHGGEFQVNCGLIFREELKGLSGKGGGGNKMAQGVFQKDEDIDIFIKRLRERLNSI